MLILSSVPSDTQILDVNPTGELQFWSGVGLLAGKFPLAELASNAYDCTNGFCDPQSMMVPGSAHQISEAVEELDETPGDLLMRGIDRAPANSRNYELGARDTGSGLSTFSNPPFTAEDIFSTLPNKDRVVNIPVEDVPSGLEWVRTTGTTGNPVLDHNHRELRDPVEFGNRTWVSYQDWWNKMIAPELADRAKQWTIIKRP
jgi:hypothetical protein